MKKDLNKLSRAGIIDSLLMFGLSKEERIIYRGFLISSHQQIEEEEIIEQIEGGSAN